MTDLIPPDTWQRRLLARYPSLFTRTKFFAAEVSAGYPTIGDGWRELVEKAVERIADAIEGKGLATVQIVQIKEKFGTLRLYWRSRSIDETTRFAINDIVGLAEARSACTCEICGAEGALYDKGGWLATACDEHSQGQKVPVRPGFENLHIVRTFADGRLRIIRCARYDRDNDSFVDVDPKTLDLAEDE